MNCKWCGSILDAHGKHTDEFKTYWKESGKVRRARLYRVWANIKERCSNPRQQRYKDYGGRGITLCQEWHDFATFRKWMFQNGWKPGLQMDRRDNDKGYFPENCRIVNRYDQQQNRRLPNRHKTGKRYATRQLSPEDVYFIRESGLTNAELARQFDIHNATVSKIKRRLTWMHLPERSSALTRREK